MYIPYLPVPVPTERPFLSVIRSRTKREVLSAVTTTTTTGTGTGTGMEMNTTSVELEMTGMKIRRRFGDYDDHKNENNDSRSCYCDCTFRPSLDLPDISYPNSPYCRHNLIDLAAYVLHLTSDLWDLWDR